MKSLLRDLNDPHRSGSLQKGPLGLEMEKARGGNLAAGRKNIPMIRRRLRSHREFQLFLSLPPNPKGLEGHHRSVEWMRRATDHFATAES